MADIKANKEISSNKIGNRYKQQTRNNKETTIKKEEKGAYLETLNKKVLDKLGQKNKKKEKKKKKKKVLKQ